MRVSAEQTERRRGAVLDCAFSLYAERGIEAVTMQDIADAAGVGVASVYRYYSDKLSLVVAAAARMWERYFEEVEAAYAACDGAGMNAFGEFDFYLERYIVLYRDHPDILRFHDAFFAFVHSRCATADDLAPYYAVIDTFFRKFHVIWDKALADGTMRTDRPEEELFFTSMFTMFSPAARFAQGVIYPAGNRFDCERALQAQKQMLLDSVRPPSGT